MDNLPKLQRCASITMSYIYLAHFLRDHWTSLVWLGLIFVIWFLVGFLIMARFFWEKWHDEL